MDIKQGGDGTNADDVEGEGDLLLVLRALLLKQNERMDEMQQEMKSMRQLIVRGHCFVLLTHTAWQGRSAADEEPVTAVGVVTTEEPSLTDKTPLGVWQHRGAAPEQEDCEPITKGLMRRSLDHEQIAILTRLFEQYDLDASGTINSVSELEQLTINAVFKLGVKIEGFRDIESVISKCDFGGGKKTSCVM